MGWYDANPVNLNPMTPEDTAKKWVEYLGDTDRVLEMARSDYEKGEYQWVAQVTKELVFADPSNQEARQLCADALEQLGYQAESGTWRNAYLTGALELREGNQSEKAKTSSGGMDVRLAMTGDMILDLIDISTDAMAAQGDDLSLNLIIDQEETYYVKRKSGVLLVYQGEKNDEADCTLNCTKPQLLTMISGDREVFDQLEAEGDATVPERLVKYMTPSPRNFNIIEP
jgi:alkyl sulfatase BDS1-like metallo-beta-lactamase superfamily hydrolase